jgi:hypothetical protein
VGEEAVSEGRFRRRWLCECCGRESGCESEIRDEPKRIQGAIFNLTVLRSDWSGLQRSVTGAVPPGLSLTFLILPHAEARG